MANTPRPAADGMDSEVLRQQDLKNASQQPKHLRISPPSSSRHRNLNASPSSTSFSKVSGAVYIPHEPVKGAVKATLRTNPSKLGTKTDKLNTKVLSQTTNYREQSLLKTKPGLSEDRISFDNPIKPQMTVSEAVGSKPSTTGVVTNARKELVKSIQVPFYNAPGHLSAKTYQTMEKYQKDKLDNEVNKPLTQNIENGRRALNSSAKTEPAPEVAITIDAEDRRVEGQVTSPADTLKKEVENLKDQLHVQTKVNGELKKLLVASMGDDLHYRVECLVRTNAQLAADMGLYSSKISQDGENIDQLGIQADIWQSKYHASRVQVDELLALKSATSQRYEQACTALEELLKERYQLRDSLFNTYRVLQQLCDAFEPLPPTNRPASYAPKSVTDIAARNYKLADNMKFRLLGTIQLYPALYNTATPMGDDLHYRVECLVRTNAQLAADMGLYSSKISQDGENIDQLGIQADIWRSKYHASRVQVDELLALKSATSQRYEQACTALEELLKERYQLRDSLFNTYRVLQQLCDAFEPLPPTNRPASYAPKSVTDIAARNYKLADNMKFRLLGTIQLYPALYNTATPNVMTPAEQMGIKILTEKPDMADNESRTAVPNVQLSTQIETKFSRHSPHPYARYDNITFNCCRRCCGEIKIV